MKNPKQSQMRADNGLVVATFYTFWGKKKLHNCKSRNILINKHKGASLRLEPSAAECGVEG